MANWNGLVLTDKGRNLAAKVEAGKTKRSLTKIKLGDGQIGVDQTLETLSDLVSPKQVIGIASLTVSEIGVCTIAGTVSNVDLATGYNVKELGIFATDPDLGEILYCITTDPNYDYLPAQGGATVVSEAFYLNLGVGNTDNVVAIIDPQALLTVAGASSLIAAHNTDENAHAVLFKTAVNDTSQSDNTGKGASTSWVRGLLGRWKAFTASQITDFKAAVVQIFKDTAIEVLQITYRLESNGFIKFGLFGGFTIQWGVFGNSGLSSFSYPTAFSQRPIFGIVTENDPSGWVSKNGVAVGAIDLSNATNTSANILSYWVANGGTVSQGGQSVRVLLFGISS